MNGRIDWDAINGKPKVVNIRVTGAALGANSQYSEAVAREIVDQLRSAIVHRTRTEPYGTGNGCRAACECGWTGPRHLRSVLAWGDERLHKKRAAKPPTFTDEQIAAAVAAVNAMPAKKNDPNKIAMPWPQPDQMPTIADVDFRDVQVKSVPIDKLLASNDTIKRDKVLWHVQNPGQSSHPSVFTGNPIVLACPDGNVIVDGQHRLFALSLLGQKTWPCYVVPSK